MSGSFPTGYSGPWKKKWADTLITRIALEVKLPPLLDINAATTNIRPPLMLPQSW